ncbi:ATP-dependent DNA helicase [Trichonephila clavipes]|nr:ATP-dependent DNA helicase [Trichonephila clavipes]
MTLMSIGLPEPAISHAYVETDSYNLEAERQEGFCKLASASRQGNFEESLPNRRRYCGNSRRMCSEEIFGSSVFDTENLSGKAILCPKNKDSLKINKQVLARFPGQNATYFSADSIISEDYEEQFSTGFHQ